MLLILFILLNMSESINNLCEGLITDVSKICESYLSDDERLYYKGEKEWNKFDKDNVCWIAAENGWLDLLKWAHEPNYCFNYTDYNICENAVKKGHLEIVKWMKVNGYHMDISIWMTAATFGQLHILKWGLEIGWGDCGVNRVYDNWKAVLAGAAALKGHFEVLKWTRENDYEFDRWTCNFAKQYGDLEILNWIKDNGCVCGGEYH